MIALLGSLFGFIGAIVPEFFKIYQDHQDKKHELAIMQLQMDSAKVNADIRHEEIGAWADSAEEETKRKTWATGIRWVDALNGTVRPVMIYALFSLYAWQKIIRYSPDMPWLVWNEMDQALFATVISFYFGGRAMQKMHGR